MGLDERLPGEALSEFVFGRQFSKRVLLTDRRVDPVPRRWLTRGHHIQAAGSCPGQAAGSKAAV